MRGRIIAVDFDGTLCRDCYPKIGEANEGLIRRLKELRMQGDRLILWTCRSGERLEEALFFCSRISSEQSVIILPTIPLNPATGTRASFEISFRSDVARSTHITRSDATT